LFVSRVRTQNCATNSWLSASDARSASDDWRHAADSSRTRGGSSAHREGVKAADPSIKRADELLVCAAVACRADELGGVPDFALGRWARNISRPKQVTDWVARLEKLEQAPAAESDRAACSCSELGSRRMCQTVCATNSLVRKIPACLCQVHRLLAADRGWGCASAHREAEGRRIPGSRGGC
jgi:hypothetical protein